VKACQNNIYDVYQIKKKLLSLHILNSWGVVENITGILSANGFWLRCKKILKSANICQSYSKNKRAQFFMTHVQCRYLVPVLVYRISSHFWYLVLSASCLIMNQIFYSFSPLGKLADLAIYFACFTFFVLSFFNDFSETNYLRICWTDFCNLFTE